MDKSFNDQELSDIMKEIEALEEEFTGEEQPEKDILAELEEEIASSPQSVSKIVSMEKPVSSKKSQSQTSMSFQVSGDLNLDLEFDVGGKIVKIDVSDKGLCIQMDGGVTFNIPLSDSSSVKKAV